MGCIVEKENEKEKPQLNVVRLERPFCFVVAKDDQILLYDVVNEQYVCVLDNANTQLPILCTNNMFLQMDRFCLSKWTMTENKCLTNQQVTFAPVREPSICTCHRLISIPHIDHQTFFLNRKSHFDPNNRIDIFDYDFNLQTTLPGNEYVFISKVDDIHFLTLRYERYIGFSTMLHEITEFVKIDQTRTVLKTILSHNTTIHSDCCSMLVLRDGTLVQAYRNGYILFLQCDDWSEFHLEHVPFPERLDDAFPCFDRRGRQHLPIAGFTRHHMRNNQETRWIYLNSPSGKNMIMLETTNTVVLKIAIVYNGAIEFVGIGKNEIIDVFRNHGCGKTRFRVNI